MTRRWRESARRARRYAATPRAQRTPARVALRFIWLRRSRARGERVHFGVNLRFHTAVTLKREGEARAAGQPDRGRVSATVQRLLVRHERGPVPSARPHRLPLAPTLRAATREVTRLIERHGHTTNELRERLTDRLVRARLTIVTAGRRGRARACQHAFGHQTRAERGAQPTPTIIRSLRERVDHAHRSHRHTQTLVMQRWLRERPDVHANGNGQTPTTHGQTPLPLEVVERRALLRTAASRAFAAQPQPFAVPAARSSAVESVPVERIERTLRESLTAVAERTVRTEVERTLRPGSTANRRLRESIQSELYDDIVFERERRGDR